jgi:hypothetical protein
MYLFCGLRAVFVVGDSESHLVGHAFILEFFESSCNKFPSVEGKPNVVGLELPIQILGTKRRSALVLLVTFSRMFAALREDPEFETVRIVCNFPAG